MIRNVLNLNIFTLLFIGCSSKIFTINSYASEADDELVSVVVLFRHGDRTPLESFPNDPYFDISYWPEGYGQLLNKGKERHYELGKWFRKRYTGFLPEDYSPKDFRVISTDVDRTLISAASNLAGLYPPTESEIWNENLLWEPIPIHTTSTKSDEILAMEKQCPKYDKLYDETISSEYFKNVSIEYKFIYDYISEHSGWNDTTLYDIGTLYSIFYVYQNYNASYIPAWATNLDHEKFTYLAGLDFATLTFTDELKRLKAGPFFNYLITYFDNVVQKNEDTPKFLMLSAHDLTITSVLNSMGAYDNWPPEFASTVMWELRKNNNGIHYINLLYKRNSSEIVEELTVTGCTFNCIYDEFKNNLIPVTLDTSTWAAECFSSASQNKSYWAILFLMVMLMFPV